MTGVVSDRGAKIAASRLRITVEEYLDCIAAGERWCGRCGQWKPKSAFPTSEFVSVGVLPYCRPCFYAYQKARRRAKRTVQ